MCLAHVLYPPALPSPEQRGGCNIYSSFSHPVLLAVGRSDLTGCLGAGFTTAPTRTCCSSCSRSSSSWRVPTLAWIMIDSVDRRRRQHLQHFLSTETTKAACSLQLLLRVTGHTSAIFGSVYPGQFKRDKRAGKYNVLSIRVAASWCHPQCQRVAGWKNGCLASLELEHASVAQPCNQHCPWQVQLVPADGACAFGSVEQMADRVMPPQLRHYYTWACVCDGPSGDTAGDVGSTANDSATEPASAPTPGVAPGPATAAAVAAGVAAAVAGATVAGVPVA